MTNKDPWELISRGEYQEAIERYTELLSEDPQPPYHNNRGIAYLLLNDYQSALNDFSSSIAMTPDKSLSSYEYICQGMCYWFINKPDKAIESWELSLTTPYTDAAGGIQAEALYLYAGVCVNNVEIINKAQKLISKRWRSLHASKAKGIRRIDPLGWPAAIAPFLLGKMNAEDFFNVHKSVTNERLQNRWKCQIYFYLGLKALIDGDMQNYQASLRECIEHGQSKVDPEYYLARWTVENKFPYQSS